MRVLDLFAGLGGWSAAFRDHGHAVTTVDIEPSFDPDIVADVLDWPLPARGSYDVILASPPCEAFSVMNIGRNWRRDGTPRTHRAETALRLVQRTREIDSAVGPRFLFIENPRAKLRALRVLSDLRRVTVTYCRYGRPVMKPTDIWGRFPATWRPRPACANGGADHVRAPRGSRTGTQSDRMGPAAALVPYALSFEVCEAVEIALAGGPGAAVAPLEAFA